MAKKVKKVAVPKAGRKKKKSKLALQFIFIIIVFIIMSLLFYRYSYVMSTELSDHKRFVINK